MKHLYTKEERIPLTPFIRVSRQKEFFACFSFFFTAISDLLNTIGGGG